MLAELELSILDVVVAGVTQWQDRRTIWREKIIARSWWTEAGQCGAGS